jgi:hypothetical protein
VNRDLKHLVFDIEIAQIIPEGFQKSLAEGVQANTQNDNGSVSVLRVFTPH